MVLGVASGATVTLPAASGTGNIYRFFVSTTVTSNNYIIQVANGDDTMAGVAIVANDGDNSASIFETAATSDTITMNGTTTGGLLGATAEIQDVASNVFSVVLRGAATGSEATPFSAVYRKRLIMGKLNGGKKPVEKTVKKASKKKEG